MTSDDGAQKRLAAADPAARLAPLDAAERAALLDAATGRMAVRRRPVLAWGIGLVAAACAVVATVVLVPQRDPVVLTLEVLDGSGGACIPFSEEFVPILRDGSEVAFAGRVADVEDDGSFDTADDFVTIVPTEFFRGGPADLVRLQLPPGEGYVDFRIGQDLLVSAADGQALGCGLSGPDDPQLRSFYERAFR